MLIVVQLIAPGCAQPRVGVGVNESVRAFRREHVRNRTCDIQLLSLLTFSYLDEKDSNEKKKTGHSNPPCPRKPHPIERANSALLVQHGSPYPPPGMDSRAAQVVMVGRIGAVAT